MSDIDPGLAGAIDDIYADLAIQQLVLQQRAFESQFAVTAEEAAVIVDRRWQSDPDGFRMYAKILFEAGLDVQMDWCKTSGIDEQDAQERWFDVLEHSPEVAEKFAKAWRLQKAVRGLDPGQGRQSN